MENELENALQAIWDMIGRTEKSQGKFAPGSSQHTLQKNRLHSLRVASALIKREIDAQPLPEYTEKEIEAAAAPIASLMSKSEKAKQKLPPGTWQHTMLENNLKALCIAGSLLNSEMAPK